MQTLLRRCLHNLLILEQCLNAKFIGLICSTITTNNAQLTPHLLMVDEEQNQGNYIAGVQSVLSPHQSRSWEARREERRTRLDRPDQTPAKQEEKVASMTWCHGPESEDN